MGGLSLAMQAVKPVKRREGKKSFISALFKSKPEQVTKKSAPHIPKEWEQVDNAKPIIKAGNSLIIKDDENYYIICKKRFEKLGYHVIHLYLNNNYPTGELLGFLRGLSLFTKKYVVFLRSENEDISPDFYEKIVESANRDFECTNQYNSVRRGLYLVNADANFVTSLLKCAA